jgi:thiol-disulfide isomerase/thioredoxin
MWVTLKQWYQLLLERGVTHTSDDQDSPPVLITSRLEEASPDIAFSHSYRMARLFGLAPEQKSFLFKLTQNLLPTRERLHRTGKSPSPSCSFCDALQDTIEHLLICPNSSEVATPLLACLSSQADNLTAKDVTILNIHTSQSWELPAAWLVSTCLHYIWDERLAGRRSILGKFRAELIARVALLRSTRWKNYSLHNSALLLDEAINLHFN